MISLIQVSNLKQAEQELKNIGVKSSVAIDIMARKMIHLIIKLNDVPAVSANIIKQEMLAAGGDAAVSHGTINLSVEKTDVLIMGTYAQISQALTKLRLQPFGLKDICQNIEAILFIIERGGQGCSCKE